MSQTLALNLLYLSSAVGLHLLVCLGRNLLRSQAEPPTQVTRTARIVATNRRIALQARTAAGQARSPDFAEATTGRLGAPLASVRG